MYTGYKKIHAMKFQLLVIPSGLIAHLHGPEEGRRNDNYLLKSSDLLSRSRAHAYVEETDGSKRQFQVYGDLAYGFSTLLQSPFAGNLSQREQDFNSMMARIWIKVEHGFGLVVNNWPFLHMTYKHELLLSPVGRYYCMGVLLTNALNCLHPNEISQAFDFPPPSLKTYFHV